MKDKPYHQGDLRNKLIEVGIELINNDGVNNFSLRKVAAMCNVSNAAPYSHFKSKDELTRAISDHVTEQFMCSLHTAIEGQESSPEIMKLLGKAYISFFMDNPQYYQFIFYKSGIIIDLDNNNDDDYAPFQLFKQTAYQMFTSMGMPEERQLKTLIALWSLAHGIISLLTNKGVRYSGDWNEILAESFILGRKL